MAIIGISVAVAFVYALRPVQIFSFAAGTSPDVHLVPRHAVFLQTLLPLLWAIPLTPLVLLVGRRFPLTTRRWWSSGSIHFVTAVTFAVMHAFVSQSIRFDHADGVEVQNPFSVQKATILRALPTSFFHYWALLGISLAFQMHARQRAREREKSDLALRASRLEAQLARAQLESLQMQLHPHFLFNTLHAISTLVDWRPADARQMITSLSELLRITLARAEDQQVPLQMELDWLDLYLEIQQIRFQDRLMIRMDVDADTLSAAVPRLVLQPLVENAIKHGVAKRSEPSRVEIRAERRGSHLHLAVWNDGPGVSHERALEGVGLQNTRHRLQALYGDEHRIVLRNASGGGVESVVEIPLKRLVAEHTIQEQEVK